MGANKKVEKKPYGLIYSVDTNGNPDGRLCVTLRNDDKPFEGVTSFAVEEGTENVVLGLTNYSVQNAQPDTGDITISQTTYKGYPALEVVVTGTNPYIKLGFHTNCTINAEETWTASVYIESPDVNVTNQDHSAAFIYMSASNFGGFGNSWHKSRYMDGSRAITVVVVSSGYGPYVNPFMCVYFKQAGTYYLYYPQLEKKPFATSFVDGSRTYGKLIFPINLEADNFVISFWHRRPFSKSRSRDVPFFELQDGNDNYLMVKAGWSTDFYIYTQNGSRFSGNIMPADWQMDGEWIMFTFVANDGTWDVYINDIKKVSITAESVSYNRILIGNMEHNYNNYWFGGFFSNLYIGKAKIGDNLIWDDDYIQQLYQAKRPFSVPPKMPVI